MGNPIYNSMMGQKPSIMSAIQSIKQNPMQFIMQSKFNVPQNLMNDPSAIIQHLMNTGQVSQQKYNQAIEMMKKIR